jgi:phosphotransferase system HPr (HPr) family protein
VLSSARIVPHSERADASSGAARASSPGAACLTLRLKNGRGLHARPCHAIATAALAHASELNVSCAGRQADGRSILELMTLQADCGAELTFEARGPDAEALLERLRGLIEGGFGESA